MRKHILLPIFISAAISTGTVLFAVNDTADPFNVDTVTATSDNNDDSITTATAKTLKNSEVKEEIKKDGFPIQGTIVGCSALRIREWPWGPVHGSFPSGTSVTITGESGEFFIVEVNGQTGYMHKNYINSANNPASGLAPYYPGNTASGGYLPREEGVKQSNFAAGETSTSNNSSNGNVSNNSNNSGNSGSKATSGNEPAAQSNGASSGAISSNSPDFNKWVDDAVNAYASSWNFPTVTNKYGRTITPRDFILAIMWIESGGVHRNASGKLTTSCCGAQGFMQLMPSTSKGLGIADPTDPAQNLMGSTKCFKEIFNCKNIRNKTGEEKIIMAACGYNMGPYSSKLAGTWEQFKASGTSVQFYGIKLKACLGLELTANERSYLQSKGTNPDTFQTTNYSHTKGLGAFK